MIAYDMPMLSGLGSGRIEGRRGTAIRSLAILFALACLLAPAAWGQATGGAKAGAADKRQDKAPREAPLPAELRALERLSVVLGRPTDSGATLNLLGDRDQEAYVEYGAAAGAYGAKSGTQRLAANQSAELSLTGLAADREYFYRVQAKAAGEAAFSAGPAGRFRTQRAPGAEFSFEIIGDSHPERAQQFDPLLYIQNLKNSAAAKPDFFMTIGDDFSVDTLPAVTKEAVANVYRRQRLYLSLVGSVAPIFLVNGNHEQASLANLDGTPDNVAVWAQNQRNASFPQPAPDAFYSGDAKPVEHIGLLRDYYAFTWGDALFVVIDPYWHSPTAVDNVYGGGEKTRDLWKTTLGEEQYAWFKKTLETSKASFKFVFAHHVSGTGRGGVERAPYFEWGGKSADGKNGFAAARPGWAAPVHELMAKNKVTAFVQGHDHIFANQLLDGVAYITLPEPADPNYTLYNRDAFTSGDCLPNSGRVRFTVGPKRVAVEYWREWLPGDAPPALAAASASAAPAKPAYRFEIPLGGAPSKGVFDPNQLTPDSPTGNAEGLGGAGNAAKAEGQGKQAKAAGAEAPAAEKKQKEAQGAQAAGAQAAKGEKAKPSAAPAAAEPILPAGSLHAGTLVEYPGSTSVSLATAFLTEVEYFYEYGPDPAKLDRATPKRIGAANTVARDAITGLLPGRDYGFRLVYAPRGSAAYAYGKPGSFSTQKEPGQAFTFVVEADPHLDENSSGSAYAATLARMAKDSPDFAVDLGDTSMAEKLAKDPAGYLARNQLFRSYWDDIGSEVPFFMVLGNHDGEHGWSVQKGQPTSDEAAALRRTWLLDQRDTPRDVYDVFSDTAYACEWGDALIVVLDPFAAATTKPGEDGWGWTLGKKQYDWLTETLSRSKASYRFVFVHNMLGGKGKDARGGADYADYYEWGGATPVSGSAPKDEFAAKRPGWALPLHDLFVKYRIDVVFRGHDHFYAKEEKDGIVYQLVPQPSLARSPRLEPGELADYGYTKGTFLPSPGYLRVAVAPGRARIEYVSADDGSVADAYDLKP